MVVTTSTRLDATLAEAVQASREALLEVADPDAVGEHLGMSMVAERLATHRFACTAPGYVGWYWAVTISRMPRQRTVTICESELLPGDEALLAPAWVPYADRLAPGDLGPADALPYRPDDPFLEQGFEATGDEDVDAVAFFELGLGRPRVLSAQGRSAAADRWYHGAVGPTSEMAAAASAQCASCGFLLPMAGALRAAFGVCANEWSPVDGRVIALDFGCGAHSETDVPADSSLPIPAPLVDELRLDPM